MARRVRLGFLVPPGNPTVEPEVIEMAPRSVSVHFSRMVAHGPTGTLDGQEERNRTQIQHIGESAALLAMVKPDVIMLAHPATRLVRAPRPNWYSVFEINVGPRSRRPSAACLPP
jgi:maleate isomerase